MPIPRTFDELQSALVDAAETTYIDYKRQLPERKSNHEIAIDVTAMSVEGGVLVYGVEENKATRTFTLCPIDLVGVEERIANVVRDRAGGSVPFSVHTIEDPNPENTGKGYAIVVVSESPLAPHMVEGHGMWGRGPAGNRMLTGGDIDRLFERRKAFSVTGAERIARARARSSLVALSEMSPGVLRLVIKPLTSSTGVMAAAGLGESGSDLIQFAYLVRGEFDFVREDIYGFSHLRQTATMRTAHGIKLVPSGIRPELLMELEVMDDGTVEFSHGGIISTKPPATRALFDTAVAQMTAHALAMAGVIYVKSDYRGAVTSH